MFAPNRQPFRAKENHMTTGLWRRRPWSFVRGAIALFIGLTCLQVWVGPDSLVEPARAQIPDSGLQRKQLLDETRRTNQLLSEIVQILRERTLNVRVLSADERAGTPVRASRRP